MSWLTPAFIVALTALAAWLYLALGHGRFWSTAIASPAPDPACWPGIVAVVPARDEAATIGATVASLLRQDYAGSLRLVVVDDQSRDGTGRIAREAAAAAGAADRLTLVEGSDPPAGWTGKLWAVRRGIEAAGSTDPDAAYLLLTDADIDHAPGNLPHLVARAEAERLDLNSTMVRLRCRTWAERWLVPPFVFFFQLLYPFAWAGRADRRTAAAAGGCMLVRRRALERIGGIETIRGALIDDCALAAALKRHGPIRLELTDEARSLRAYDGVGEIWRMIARSAYTQLRYSPLLLAGTVLGLGVVFLAPPLLTLAASGAARAAALLAWVLMAGCYLPMLQFYGRSPVWAPLLPAAALLYLGATVNSARRHLAGKGGAWKGRVHGSGGAMPAARPMPARTAGSPGTGPKGARHHG